MASLEEFESILNAVGRGERGAFHQLYNLTAARLFGLCKAILDDDDWADEVIESAYIEIWQNAIGWQDSGLTPLTWVLSITREHAINARRETSGDETPDPSGGGDVSISVSPVTKPGMMASGSVTFSDGVTCDWYLDQFGRPGLVPPAEGYRPPDADMPVFGQKLQEALQGGY